LDWDDSAVEEHWCDECHRTVAEYLAKQSVVHGEVGSWPAWHVAPYVSIWAIESLLAPGHVGWWAICGDLPTDYLSAATIKHPRKALLAFADLWKEVAEYMQRDWLIPIRPSGHLSKTLSLHFCLRSVPISSVDSPKMIRYGVLSTISRSHVGAMGWSTSVVKRTFPEKRGYGKLRRLQDL
jgi:hypothetical protein